MLFLYLVALNIIMQVKKLGSLMTGDFRGKTEHTLLLNCDKNFRFRNGEK